MSHLTSKSTWTLQSLLFVLGAAVTARAHWLAPMGPGQDYPYHLFVSSIAIRGDSDPAAALYTPL